MADRATTIEEQIALLESRGMKIDDKEKYPRFIYEYIFLLAI